MMNLLSAGGQAGNAQALWAPLFDTAKQGAPGSSPMLHARIDNAPDGLNPVLPQGAAQGAGGLMNSFGHTLGQAIEQVNTLQQNANASVEAYATGQETELHQVIMSVGKAETALALTVQIRNKLIDAYQEISRMSV
ncbi:MAG: flagellar hook-basal body complex protein FliE [Vampirovibrionales bacterium]|nr:flagellar hook-basal body complex protein FliE [Vampirovibrionales bacterium]